MSTLILYYGGIDMILVMTQTTTTGEELVTYVDLEAYLGINTQNIEA